MDIQRNKNLVGHYWALFAKGDPKAILSMMADDADWIVKGNPSIHSGAGQRTKKQMANIWQDLFALFPSGLKMKVVHMLAEQDRVATEIHAQGLTSSGKVYDNDYLMLVTLRNEQIVRVVEYTDLSHAELTFYGA